jgi:hypothetical protein
MVSLPRPTPMPSVTLLTHDRIPTAIILMKLCFATGVLAIPSAFSTVGYGPGIILLIFWGALTTCMFPSPQLIW